MPTYRFDIQSKRISTDTGAATASAVFVDLLTDTLYLVNGTSVLPMHGGPLQMATWRGKFIKVPSGAMTGFAWARFNGTLGTGATLKLYVDGALAYTTPVVTSLEPFRLPAIEGRALEVEIASKDRITSVALADSAENLV